MPNDHAQRETRLGAIKALLEQEIVRGQGEIAQRLRTLGFEVTQSSISRDLHDLGVAKMQGRYVLAAALAAPEPAKPAAAYEAVLRANVTGWSAAGPHVLVVHTVIGAASPVGLAIDHAAWPEVVGTVAGDDTLFIATAGKRHQNRLRERLTGLVPAAVERNFTHA